MEPRIGRSIREGFVVANRSWAGIGAYAASWIAVGALALAVLMVTRPPGELFEEPAVDESSSLLDAGAALPVEEPLAADALATPDFSGTTDGESLEPVYESASPPPLEADGSSPDAIEALAANPAAEDAARRDRLFSEWFGRSWPLLLIVLIGVMAASIWLTGAQIGYLVERVRGGSAPLSVFWASGTRAFGALLGGWAISLAAFVASVLVIGLLIALTAFIGRVAPQWLTGVLAALGGIALAVGMVWLLVRLSFWFIVIVADRLGPWAGLKAGFKMTRGLWWQIAGLGLLVAVLSYVAWLPSALLEWIGGAVGDIAGTVLAVLGTLLGGVASVYMGFVSLAAYIRFYEDAKSAAPAGQPAGS